MNGRLLLPEPQQSQVQIASPFNDVQLVAMIAAHRQGVPAKEAVAWAVDCVTEALVQAGGRKIVDAFKAKQAEQQSE